MKKIEAQTLEDALIIASKAFECSVMDLEYEIIQNPSKGFLGIGKKPLIVCVQSKLEAQEVKENVSSSDDDKLKHKKLQSFSKDALEQIAKEVQQELKTLFAMLPYEIALIFVEPYDENTLYIKLDGEDSALLIGKKGYRYKAISYLIFNWVNHKYGLMIRLEIAEFLHNQEDIVASYLVPIIESIKATGKAQTKPLDGVLAHIALKQLRAQFPEKYVSFRMNSDGQRYVIVNDFYHS